MPLRYSYRDGTYLYFADRAVSVDQPFNKITSVRVSRNTGKRYAQLITVTRARSVAEFKSIGGEKVWAELKLMQKLTTDDDVWKFILAHPLLDEYGTLSFNMSFRQAMGNALLDKEAAALPVGEKWLYKVEWLDATGGIVNTAEGSVTGNAASFVLARAHKQKVSATDSVVMASWFVISKKVHSSIIMADVYRQTGGKGAFEKLPSPLFANPKKDSLQFSLMDNVVPSTLYRYYIIPTDDIGNPSQRSDTINVLSFDFRSLPLLSSVAAHDTVNGINLTWKPIGDKPQVTGIEIQRSRDARGNYVVIDTVEVLRNSYLDTQVFPDIPYFYRLRVIGLKGLEKETGYSGYATAVLKNKNKNPDPPYGLKGNVVNGKIHLQWQSVTDPDLSAYFVYRGVSESGKFEVISSGLKTTEYTDTSSVNGRTQFVYAVKAVNNNSLESEFSNKISMRQNVLQLPQEPAGVNVYVSNRTIIVEWPSSARTDYAVAGYNVYRRELQPKNNFDSKQSAAAQATVLKFVALNNVLIKQTRYEDAHAISGKTYEYAIAAVDVFGAESTYSPFGRINYAVPVRIVTTCVVRKVTAGVALSWDESFMSDAETIVIYRKKAGDASYQKTASVKKGLMTYVDNTTVKGVLYSYVIHAEKENNILAKSDEKNIKY